MQTFPSLYAFPWILFDFTQRLHFSRPFFHNLLFLWSLRLKFFKSWYFLHAACLSLSLCLCVSSKRERQRHSDHGNRAGRWRRRNLHAFCSHGPLLQVPPEYQHSHFFAFSSTFLSFILPAQLLFLSARQFCRIRPRPISISVHHTAAFLTLLQNFATFLDAFLVVQPLGEFPFPLTETSEEQPPLFPQYWWHPRTVISLTLITQITLYSPHRSSLAGSIPSKVYDPTPMVFDIFFAKII